MMIIFLLLISLVLSCGEVPIHQESNSFSISLAKSLNAQLPQMVIAKYQIKITSDHFEAISKEVLAGQTKALFENIPLGVSFSVIVQAYNEKGDLLQQGELESLKLKKGGSHSVPISLESLPVILNLASNALSTDRARVRLYVPPGESLLIEGFKRDGGKPWALQSQELTSDENGFILFNLTSLPLGEYEIVLTNLNNGRSIKRNIAIEEASRKGAPLISGGALSSNNFFSSSIGRSFVPAMGGLK